MACSVNTLLLQGAAFQALSEREQMLVIAQLLCDISGGGGTGFVFVFSNGTAIGPNGLINTTGTTTSGIQEAINSLPVQSNYAGPESGGGYIYLGPGIFSCSSQITIPNTFPFDLTIQGGGKMRTMVTYTGATQQDFIVCQRTVPSSPVDSAGYPSLNIRVNDCAFTYQNDTNLSAILNLTYVNEGIFHNCAFATYQSFKVPGFGASLVYIDGTPLNKVGTIGAIISQTAQGNIVNFRHCAFYGLACGLDLNCDHARVENTIFANCGAYWPAGRNTPRSIGTLWTAGIGISRNAYFYGFAFIRSGGVFECVVTDCQWFNCNVIAGHECFSGVGSMTIINPLIESCVYGPIHIGSAVLQKDGEQGNPTVIYQGNQGGNPNVPAGGYINHLTSVLTAGNPMVYAIANFGPGVHPDITGGAATDSFSYSGFQGQVQKFNYNGLVLFGMTKAARNALSGIETGQFIYQTDNTPGPRVYDGTNWNKFTLTTDP